MGYAYGVMRCDRTWKGPPLGFVTLSVLEEWRGGVRGMGWEKICGFVMCMRNGGREGGREVRYDGVISLFALV